MKTLDITAKEWWDKINGNAYFSARIVIDYGTEQQRCFYLPYQYGYGDQYEWETISMLKNEQLMDAQNSNCLSIYCNQHNIILRQQKFTKCLKKDVKNWGKL